MPVVSTIIQTSAPMEEVVKRVSQALLSTVGGNIIEQGDTIHVKGGTNGVSMAFAADISAVISINKQNDSEYLVQANVNKSPNALFWISLIIGFFVFLLSWIVNIMYLFVDPAPAYQGALAQAQSMLRQDNTMTDVSKSEGKGSIKAQLEELQDLLDQDLITQDEYDLKRGKIINQ